MKKQHNPAESLSATLARHLATFKQAPLEVVWDAIPLLLLAGDSKKAIACLKTAHKQDPGVTALAVYQVCGPKGIDIEAELYGAMTTPASYAAVELFRNKVKDLYKLASNTPDDTHIQLLNYVCDHAADRQLRVMACSRLAYDFTDSNEPAFLQRVESVAKLGHAESMVVLGNLYLDGGIVPRDTITAARWYIRAGMMADDEIAPDVAVNYLQDPTPPWNRQHGWVDLPLFVEIANAARQDGGADRLREVANTIFATPLDAADPL